jgi:hypothetical protein
MKAEANGQPVIARARWGLGVRIEGPSRDVEVVGGMVWPLGGGMSVAKDWHTMMRSFIPMQLGGTNSSETMFSLPEEALPPSLKVRQAGQRKGHFVVEPERMMPIQEYEGLLTGTQALWERVGP